MKDSAQVWASKTIRVLAWAFFGFTLAQLVYADRLWVWEFTTFIPPMAMIVTYVFLLLGVAALKDWKLLLVLFIVSPAMVRILDFGFQLNSDQSQLGEVTIFNWNTEFWEEEASEQELLNHLKDNSADVLHLQEALQFVSPGVHGQRDVETKVGEALGEDYFVIQFGELVTATRLEVVDFYNSDEGAFLRLDAKVDGEVVSFYNVHVPVHVNPRLFPSPIRLIQDVKERFYWRKTVSETLLADLQSNPNVKVISGDFNTQKAMPLIYPYLDNFADAFASTSFGIPTTINVGGVKLWRIDYVLGDRVSFKTYQDVNPLQLSDHWGQFVSFDIN